MSLQIFSIWGIEINGKWRGTTAVKDLLKVTASRSVDCAPVHCLTLGAAIKVNCHCRFVMKLKVFLFLLLKAKCFEQWVYFSNLYIWLVSWWTYSYSGLLKILVFSIANIHRVLLDSRNKVRQMIPCFALVLSGWDKYIPILQVKKLRLKRSQVHTSECWLSRNLHIPGLSQRWNSLAIRSTATASLASWQTSCHSLKWALLWMANLWPGPCAHNTGKSSYLLPTCQLLWSYQHIRKHSAVEKKEEREGTEHVGCRLLKIGQLSQTVKTY